MFKTNRVTITGTIGYEKLEFKTIFTDHDYKPKEKNGWIAIDWSKNGDFYSVLFVRRTGKWNLWTRLLYFWGFKKVQTKVTEG